MTAATRSGRASAARQVPGADGGLAARRLHAIVPRATYRVQLHAGFRFDDLTALVPYLDALGISHVYCSPYLEARPGSLHGYDVVNHTRLNPEIGSNAEFERLCRTVDSHGMGQILDMVPNHVAVMGRENAWWLDVLENGPASRYADWFDIDWQPLKDAMRNKVLLPVLGDHYGNVLDRGELDLAFDAERGSFAVDYFEHRFPIDPREYPRILADVLDRLKRVLPADDPDLLVFESLITAFANLPARLLTDEASRHERARDQRLHQDRLARLVRDVPAIRTCVDECILAFNGDESHGPDTARLHELLEQQAWRLSFWRLASHEINYRRFFDINDLASLRMEDPAVFDATHAFVLDLVRSGRVHGLRIDHPDGLYDPLGYFRRLQESAGSKLYVVAEKILAADEALREDWPVDGTTGYEFANLVTRFMIEPDGLAALEDTYSEWTRYGSDYDEVLRRSKRLIMQSKLASELTVLANELDRLAEQDPHTRDFGLGGLQNALIEVIESFPVYRTYTVEGRVSAADAAIINAAVDEARSLSETADTSVFEYLRDVLLNRGHDGRSAGFRERVARFGMRLQQYTSPVAAKGMEDTAFYRYARLISLNEVGGTPERPTATVEELHAANSARLGRWPHSMLASSTHDAKRSEDVRARIDVLSELPSEWAARVTAWSRMNERFRQRGANGVLFPTRDMEYFIYQTLIGVWPFERLTTAARDDADSGETTDFAERFVAYLVKASREAKRNTSWINPNPEYEQAVESFARALVDPATNRDFVEDFVPFVRRVARLGLYTSLSQLALKLGSPGVPDFYQGNELWRFDLVDPDNRRPVDFDRRRAILAEFENALPNVGAEAGDASGLAVRLVETIEDGRAKLFLTWRALNVRRNWPDVFAYGDFEPLDVEGDGARHIAAFARRHGDTVVVIAVLRWFATLVDGAGIIDGTRIGATRIARPAADNPFTSALGNSVEGLNDEEGGSWLASDLFGTWPVALLVSSPD